MNYELNDYREPKKPRLGSWPFWQVPDFLALGYVFRITLFVMVLPYLFGVILTPVGYFVNFMLVDYVTYVGIKKVYGLE